MTESIIMNFEANQLSYQIDLPAVISQINKDINQSGGDFELDPLASLTHSYDLLVGKTHEWLTTNEVDLQVLLYRIDVSEKDIRYMPLSPERIVDLIFKREIIKIKFRKEYSS